MIAPTAFCGMAISIVVCPIVATDLCVYNDCQDSITSLMFCPCLPMIALTAFCGMAISIVVCPIVTTDLCVYNDCQDRITSLMFCP